MKNKKDCKEEVNKLKELCLKKADELADKYPQKTFTSWDIISAVLSESSGYDTYFLTMKADIDIVRLIAEGLSASGIANRLSIPSQQVYEVAKLWGMDVLDSSLDFNPMFIYHDGMTIQELENTLYEILPIPITHQGAKVIINNLERYYDLLKFLKEYDNEES